MKSIKRFLFVALLLLVCTSAFSQDAPLGSFSIKGGTVKCSGGSGSLDLYLKTTNDKIEVMDFYIEVPTGIVLSTTVGEIKANGGITTITPGKQSEKVFNYVLETASGSYLTLTDGLLISIPFTYDDTFVGGDAKLYEIAVSSSWTGEPAAGDHADEYYDDVNFTFEFGVATETVTLTKEYNTYIPAKALDFSDVEGITAYYVTAVTATEATITKATTVAAGEGIIISGTPDDYEVPVATAEVAPSEENLLKTSGIAANDYILYNGKFVLCSDGELADGKAYLPASAFTAGAKIINIVFGGESTGINEVQKSEADGAIYNLSGMRVSKTQKGVYIMNGRKVIVK